MMYGSCDMKRDTQNFLSFWTVFYPFTPLTTWKIKIKFFFVILDHFLPFYFPNNPKNQNFEKLKKAHQDIIILLKCTKNHDHILYCSIDMMHNRCNCYLSFWAIFCPFTSLTVRKIKILKKWKKCLEISLFYTSVPKIMITCYTVPEIWCVTDVIVNFHFGLFFALLPS